MVNVALLVRLEADVESFLRGGLSLVIPAPEKKAAEIGQPQNISVVDVGGNLVTQVSMDVA